MKVLSERLFELDLTEVDGTDNLADPQGILKESQAQLAHTYGAQKSYYLINGTSSGLHVAIDGLVRDGGKVLVARNCHKSVSNIIRRKSIQPIYLYPEVDPVFGVEEPICLDQIKEVMEEDVEALILTNPSYYGRTTDLKEIYAYLEERGIPLILDAAHGAHFAFLAAYPDLVASSHVSVMSLHKTLPALGQTSVLHLGRGLQDYQIKNIEEKYNFYQTSSPSYLLLLSAELAMDYMREEGREGLERVKGLWKRAEKGLEVNPLAQVYPSEDFCKLFVKTPLDGQKLDQRLRRDYNIQAEMTLGQGILFMLGLSHEKSDIDRLVEAILEILDQEQDLYLEEKPLVNIFPRLESLEMDQQQALKNKAYQGGLEALKEEVAIQFALGRIAAQDVIPYPPGIPLIREFERINEEAIKVLNRFEYRKIWVYKFN